MVWGAKAAWAAGGAAGSDRARLPKGTEPCHICGEDSMCEVKVRRAAAGRSAPLPAFLGPLGRVARFHRCQCACGQHQWVRLTTCCLADAAAACSGAELSSAGVHSLFTCTLTHRSTTCSSSPAVMRCVSRKCRVSGQRRLPLRSSAASGSSLLCAALLIQQVQRRCHLLTTAVPPACLPPAAAATPCGKVSCSRCALRPLTAAIGMHRAVAQPRAAIASLAAAEPCCSIGSLPRQPASRACLVAQRVSLPTAALQADAGLKCPFCREYVDGFTDMNGCGAF